MDDLDCCNEDDVMDVLAAIILLLNGAPVSCMLLVDSRRVITIIDNDLQTTSSDLISGRNYLDKIIQIPFSLPELNPVQVTTFLKFTTQAKDLNIDCIVRRLTLMIKHDHIKASDIFDENFSSMDRWEKMEMATYLTMKRI